MKVERPCQNCGKECEPWQRNTDGTYLHEGCAAALVSAHGWNQRVLPTEEVPSTGAKQDES